MGFGLGGLVSGGLGLAGTVLTNRSNQKITNRQMNFQEAMSNTAHTREISDLANAGLNPILSAKYGGASTPPGASYEAQNPLASGISSAIEYRRANAEIDNIKAQNNSIRTQSDLNKALASKAKIDAGLGIQNSTFQNSLLGQQASYYNLLGKQASLSIPGLKNKAWLESGKTGKFLATADKVFDYAGKATDLISPFRVKK